MSTVELFVQSVTDLVSEHLFLGTFLAALIETVFPPIPTLAIFPLAGYLASQAGLDLPSVALLGVVAGAGATIGSTVLFLIAWKLGRTVLLRYLKYFRMTTDHLARAEAWFERHGDKAVFFGRLAPVIREMISIPAGLLRMRMPKFLLYTFLGSCAYGMITIMAGYYFGVTVLGAPQPIR